MLLRPENYLVGENPSYSVPKEVWFLCDLMQSLDLGQENLFLQPGDRCPAKPLKGGVHQISLRVIRLDEIHSNN